MKVDIKKDGPLFIWYNKEKIFNYGKKRDGAK